MTDCPTATAERKHRNDPEETPFKSPQNARPKEWERRYSNSKLLEVFHVLLDTSSPATTPMGIKHLYSFNCFTKHPSLAGAGRIPTGTYTA